MTMECGPDNCPHTLWTSLSETERLKQRKTIALQLYRLGFTQQQIAGDLGVSQWTISQDLRGLEVASKPPRPKGGRPKADGNRQVRAPKRHYKEVEIVALADKGLTRAQIAAEAGIGQRQVRHVVEREQIRREAKADPEITPDMLSMTQQQKNEAWRRQEMARMAMQFKQMVSDRVREHIDAIILPDWKQKIAQAKELFKHRRGAMDKETFNAIRRALHPDSRKSISDKKLGEAFDTFMGLEKFLLDEKDSPTAFKYPDGNGLPSSLDEWDRMKQAATAARKAKRANGSSIRPR